MTVDWTNADPELAQRCRAILGKLACLSDGKVPTQPAKGFGHHAGESAVPPEARPDRDSLRPPPKDRSLYDWYRWHFARATSDYRRRLLCYLAERDYERYIKRAPDSKRGPSSLIGDEGGTTENEAMKRVVDWYEGMDALEVAVLEECSIHHVHKARRVHRRSEHDGRPKRGWDGWDDEQRVREIRIRRERGWTQNTISGDLQLSVRTVKRYWGHAEPRRAA